MAGIGTFEVQIGQRQAECTHWLSKGYGLVPALVLRDPTLPLGAKAVYSYLLTFTGAERRDAWPSRQRIIRELGVNKDTLAKYMTVLVQRGLVRIEQSRRRGSLYGHNVYRIVEWSSCTCGVFTQTGPRRAAQHMQPVFDVYRQLIGAPGPPQRRRLRFWVDDAGLTPELVAFGIEIAVAQKKANGEPPPRMSYIEGVLRNWRNDGYTKRAQAMAHDARLAAAKTARMRFDRSAGAG